MTKAAKWCLEPERRVTKKKVDIQAKLLEELQAKIDELEGRIRELEGRYARPIAPHLIGSNAVPTKPCRPPIVRPMTVEPVGIPNKWDTAELWGETR